MSDERKIIHVEPQPIPTGAMTVDQALAERSKLMEFINRAMRPGIDYEPPEREGDKPILYKSGMQKLNNLSRFYPDYEELEKIEEWATGFFFYRYRCHLRTRDWIDEDGQRHKGVVVSTGIGSCNSNEARYRYRWVHPVDVPIDVDIDQCMKREGTAVEFEFAVEQAQTSGQYAKPEEYWQEFRDAIKDNTARRTKKKSRKGEVYAAWEIDTTVIRIPNPDIYDQVNTIDKQAQKRALGEATGNVHSISDIYTVDTEGWTHDANGEYAPMGSVRPPRQQQPAPPDESRPEPKQRANGNGWHTRTALIQRMIAELDKMVGKHAVNRLNKFANAGYIKGSMDDNDVFDIVRIPFDDYEAELDAKRNPAPGEPSADTKDAEEAEARAEADKLKPKGKKRL